MKCQPIKPQQRISFLMNPKPNPEPKKQVVVKVIMTENKDTFIKSKLPQEGGQE